MGSGGPRKTTTEVLSSTQNDELAVVAGCTQFRRPFHCYTVTLCKVMPPGGTTLCRYYWVSKSPPRRRRVWGQTQVFSVSLNPVLGQVATQFQLLFTPGSPVFDVYPGHRNLCERHHPSRHDANSWGSTTASHDIRRKGLDKSEPWSKILGTPGAQRTKIEGVRAIYP